MSLNEISNEHLKTINASWDYHVDERHDFSDISQDNINKFIQKIEKNLDRPFFDDPMTVLRKYELIKDDKLTFAAYLLFTSNKSAITSFQIGRFKDDITIIDNIDIDTNVLEQVEVAIEFIKKHLMTEFVITGEAQRTVKYDYPLEAIREVVINMIVHRDYTDSGNSIIKIFDDRMEFFNPGKLFGDITIEKLQCGDYASRARNRSLARAIKEMGMIEQYGSGIGRIKASCLEHKVKAPIFENFSHGFRVTFFKQKSDNNTNEGISEGISEGLNLLLKYIKENPNQRVTHLQQALNIPSKTIERWIKKLKDENKIEYKGSKKTGGYFIR